jgi:hypothetical protein
MAKLAEGLDLQVYGFRIAPRDPKNPHVAAVGDDRYFFEKPPVYEMHPKILKEKPGLGGGFKIQEEMLKSKHHQNDNLYAHETEEDVLIDESNIITRDEIIKELNLAAGTSFGTEGKDGQLTKAAITKDLVDNLTKELEKLRRQSENIQMRKTLHVKGHIDEETEEERNYKIKRDLEDDKGCFVIHAENERVQAQRHQTGQLGGLGAITMEEVVEMRKLTEARIRELEIEYYKNKDTRYVSDQMRKKLQSYNEDNEVDREKLRRLREKEADYLELEAKANEIKEKKKYLQSPYNTDRSWVRRIPVKRDNDDLEVDESKLLASTKKKEEKKLSKASLKRLAYEAKFTKYRVNRKLKEEYDEEKPQKKDFDLYLKGKDSANVEAKKINWDDLFAQKLKPAKFSKDFAVYKSDYDIRMLETMRSKLDTLSKEDKLTFSILKWIFNALKKKDSKVNRRELIEQLDQNIDILQSLGFESTEDVSHQLNMLRTNTIGKLTWEEFLEFFGSKTDSFRKTGETWWKTEQEGREYFIPIDQPVKGKLDPEERRKQLSSTAYDRMVTKPDGKSMLEGADHKIEDKMKKLAESRVNKLVVEDIEKDLADLKRTKSRSKSRTKTGVIKQKGSPLRGHSDSPDKDVFKSGPQCVLHASHMELMREVYNETDKFNDQIVKRSDLIKALRENKMVQKFLDTEAIKIDRKTKLTIEDVLKELHRDQFVHPDDSGDDGDFNHKEFITWEEFVDFFEHYKSPDDKMKEYTDKKHTRKTFKSDKERKKYLKEQIEEEKDRRIEELPRFRDDDIIDTEEEYLDIIFDVFDKCLRAKDFPNSVDALEFFMGLKKDPKIIKINDTIAREPDGKSRIATETFVEVFYRMEKSHEDKYIDWPTILEYFTKRGRPLNSTEIEQRKQEDRDAEDEYEKEIDAQKEEEEQFYKNLREERKDFTSSGYEEHLFIDEGRTDIEDMEEVGNNKPDFHSTVQSKKKVSFKDSINERGSTLNKRPQTAKSKFDTTLSKDSLTGKDYSDHRKSKNSHSIDRKITVPKPFKFDTRDKIRPKSIRERKIDEMIEEKRIEEERILGYQFKAKRPAKEIITPLYSSILDKNKKRRNEVKENSQKLLKSQERPFSFYERDLEKKKEKQSQDVYLNEEFLKPAFKANDVPTVCTVELLKIMKQKEDKERELRIKKNADKILRMSRLPPRMEMYEKMKKEKESKVQAKSVEDFSRFGTFQPPKARPIPDFDRLQRNFQETLDRKKTSKKLTEPTPFKFESEAKKKGSKSKASLRTFMDAENDSKGFNASAKKQSKVGHIPKYGKPQVEPKTTKNQALLERKRREELIEKNKREMNAIMENKARYEKQNNIKKTVQTMYSALDNTKKKEKEKKDNLKAKKKGNKEDFLKNKKVIESVIEKGRSRPLLIERYEQSKTETDRELQGLRAVQMVKETMLKNGLDPSKHLSESQKDKLADAEFLEKHKLDRLPKNI